jgi:uncharacterized protein YjdB
MKTIKALLTSVLLGAFIVAGCSEPTSDSPSADRTGVVLLTFNNADARTALPEAPTFVKYGLSAQKYVGDTAEGAPVTKEITVDAGSIALTAGTWRITATGYVSGDKVAAVGESEKFSVTAGASTSVNITLYAVTDAGDGVFTYKITPPSGVALESITLTFGEAEVLTLNEGEYTGSVPSAPGVYLVKLEMTTAYQSLIRAEIAHIYSNRVTPKSWEIAAEDFATYFTLSGTIAEGGAQVTHIEAYTKDGEDNYGLYQGAAMVSENAWSMALPAFGNEEVTLYFKGVYQEKKIVTETSITVPANTTGTYNSSDALDFSLPAAPEFTWAAVTIGAGLSSVAKEQAPGGIKLTATTGSSDKGWGTSYNSENGYFVYIPITGDFELTIKLANVALSGTSDNDRVGILAMVKDPTSEDINTASPNIESYYMMAQQGSKTDARFLTRDGSTGDAANTQVPSGNRPSGVTYLRLKRASDQITGTYANSDETWSGISTNNQKTMSNITPTLYLGLLVSGRNKSASTTVTFTEVTLKYGEDLTETYIADFSALTPSVAIETEATSPMAAEEGVNYQAQLPDYPSGGVTLTASTVPAGEPIVWSVEGAPAGASVSNGAVTITTAGTYTVKATSGALSASYVFKILPAVASVTVSGDDTVAAGQNITLTAEVSPEGAVPGVTWSVDDTSKATIDADAGVLTGVAAGQVTVTATSKGKGANGASVTGTKTVTVNEAVTVTSVTVSGDSTVAAGQNITLTAEVKPESAVQGVTWAVYLNNNGTGDASAVATIDANGALTAKYPVAQTNVYVFATSTQDTTKTSDAYTVTVQAAAAVTSVTVSGDDTVSVGKTITLTAAVSPEDAVPGVTWSVDDTSKATIDADAGVLTGVAAGQVTVTATSVGNASVKGTKSVTVTPLLWNFSDDAFKSVLPTASFSDTSYTIDGITIATDSSTMSYGTSSKSFSDDEDNLTFTHRLQLGGTGSKTRRVVKFDVTGPCTIYVYLLTSSSGNDRPLKVVNDTGFDGTIQTTEEGSNVVKRSVEYTGEAGTIYLYSGNSGINLYGVKVVPSTGNEVDQPVSLSLSIDFTDKGVDMFEQGDFTVSKTGTGSNATKIITVAEETWDSIAWYVDGKLKGTNKSITISATKYTLGGHTLDLEVAKDGVPWSKTVTFTVTQ